MSRRVGLRTIGSIGGKATRILEIECDWYGDVFQWSGEPSYRYGWGAVLVGYSSNYEWYRYRSACRFPLSTLPPNARILKVELVFSIDEVAGGEGHLLDIHPYAGDAQRNPEADYGRPWEDAGAEIYYNLIAQGTPYVDDSPACRTLGEKTLDLGAQACTDIMVAKIMVNRFSLGLHEEGDDDAVAVIRPEVKLRITYVLGAEWHSLTIDASWGCDVVYNIEDGSYEKYVGDGHDYVGREDPYICRTGNRFSLGSLPANATVKKAEYIFKVDYTEGADHLLDVHPYGGNGQADPEVDSAEVMFNRCVEGIEYNNDSDSCRTAGTKVLDLGAQACVDIEVAKAAVDRFSLGMHEEGDDSISALIFEYIDIGMPNWEPPKLRIIYTIP